MSAMECLESEIVEIGGEKIVVEKSKPGDFVVCNLASLVLGNIDLNDREGLKKLISVTVRALDNVIDLNYYPLPYAQITNHQMRPIGLGTSGYHHALVKNGLSFESHEHCNLSMSCMSSSIILLFKPLVSWRRKRVAILIFLAVIGIMGSILRSVVMKMKNSRLWLRRYMNVDCVMVI